MAIKVAHHVQKTLGDIEALNAEDKKLIEKKIGDLSGHKVVSLIVLGVSSVLAATAAVVAAVFAAYLLAAACAATFAILSLTFIVVSRTNLSKDLISLIEILRNKADELFKSNNALHNEIVQLKNQNLLQHPIEKMVPENKERLLENDKLHTEIKENLKKIEKDLEEKNNQLKDFDKIKKDLANKEKVIKELMEAQPNVKKKIDELVLKNEKEKLENELKNTKDALAKEKDKLQQLNNKLMENKPKIINMDPIPSEEEKEVNEQIEALKKQIAEKDALIAEKDAVIEAWSQWELKVRDFAASPIHEMAEKICDLGYPENEELNQLIAKGANNFNPSYEKALHWSIETITAKYDAIMADIKIEHPIVAFIKSPSKKQRKNSQEIKSDFLGNLLAPFRIELGKARNPNAKLLVPQLRPDQVAQEQKK